jgi:hypothetical protein
MLLGACSPGQYSRDHGANAVWGAWTLVGQDGLSTTATARRGGAVLVGTFHDRSETMADPRC